MAAFNPNYMGDILHLNVGGKRFSTSRQTLTWIPDTFFTALLNGRISSLHDEKGAIFIDRDPRNFAIILNFLRTREVDMRDTDLRSLRHEAEYYGIAPLVKRLILFEKMAQTSSSISPQETATTAAGTSGEGAHFGLGRPVVRAAYRGAPQLDRGGIRLLRRVLPPQGLERLACGVHKPAHRCMHRAHCGDCGRHWRRLQDGGHRIWQPVTAVERVRGRRQDQRGQLQSAGARRIPGLYRQPTGGAEPLGPTGRGTRYNAALAEAGLGAHRILRRTAAALQQQLQLLKQEAEVPAAHEEQQPIGDEAVPQPEGQPSQRHLDEPDTQDE